MLILSSPGGRQGLCFCDELNPKFTTGEKHEENHSQDRRHHVIAVSSGRIFRNGRYGTRPGMLAQALPGWVGVVDCEWLV
jgi:hypothetical protein